MRLAESGSSALNVVLEADGMILGQVSFENYPPGASPFERVKICNKLLF